MKHSILVEIDTPLKDNNLVRKIIEDTLKLHVANFDDIKTKTPKEAP
jgi:hypothetical protein